MVGSIRPDQAEWAVSPGGVMASACRACYLNAHPMPASSGPTPTISPMACEPYAPCSMLLCPQSPCGEQVSGFSV